MSPHHFMRDDLLGSMIAVILFTGFLFVPGYVIGWLTNVRDFRREPGVWRVLWSLPLSVGVMPIIGFLAGSYLGMGTVWGIYTALLATAAIMMIGSRPAGGWPRWLVAACIGWMLVAILSGVDVQWGSRLYPSVLIYDYNVRAALIDGISRQGLPAINPLFYPGHFVPLRYHYFWFIPCSLVSQLSGGLVAPRQALIASDVWCGWALVALLLLYLRYFHKGGDPLGKRGKWACLLLAAAGLDVIPNALAAAVRWTTSRGFVYASAEWWNTPPVTGYPHAVLWVAHHVACAIACLLGFLLLWKRERTDRWAVPLAGVCFASATGLSIYVAFTFALTMVAWLAWAVLGRRWRTAGGCMVAGTLAAALASPYLLAMAGDPGAGGSFVRPTVRSFTILEYLLRSYHWSWPAVAAANLVALPLNYFLEAAMLVVVAWIVIRRCFRNGARTDESRAAVVLLAVPLLVASFLRSGVLASNDFGWRAPLIAQVVAVVVGASIVRALIERARKRADLSRVRGLVVTLLVLGVASSVWDLLAMRAYPMLVDAGWAQEAFWLRGRDIGERTFAMRELYEDLQRRVPRNAVVQANPHVWNQVYLGAYAQRQTASFDFECGAVMGGDPRLCAKMQPALLLGFNDPHGSHDVEAMCGTGGIDVLILDKSDSAARDGPPVESAIASSGYARAVMCRAQPLVAHRRYR
jgi:hypothetical protein